MIALLYHSFRSSASISQGVWWSLTLSICSKSPRFSSIHSCGLLQIFLQIFLIREGFRLILLTLLTTAMFKVHPMETTNVEEEPNLTNRNRKTDFSKNSIWKHKMTVVCLIFGLAVCHLLGSIIHHIMLIDRLIVELLCPLFGCGHCSVVSNQQRTLRLRF